MADPSSEDDGLLQEWAPLTDLLQQIPLKAQKGLFTQDLNLTCIDALPDFLVIGTSVGLVYWYNRKTCDLERLRCENNSSSVTCVKVVSTVDYMVAAGNDLGIVTVFQIPKMPPDCLPESMQPKKKSQVERYTISSLHKGPVTAIEWSTNGMKLFSGDKSGLVVLTEIDFYMHLSKSSELLNEKYEIVQLSYYQQLLLVSTVYRSIICLRDSRLKVVQVGQKERKTLGRFGATFVVGPKGPLEPIIYASRPGLRLWLADKSGTVQQTLIYKDAVLKPHFETPLINPIRPHLKQPRNNHHFGPLKLFHKDLLITYSKETIYLLNPCSKAVAATVSALRAVHDVAVTKDEIFVLEGERSLIRIAYTPELPVASSILEDHQLGMQNGTLPTATIPDNLASSIIDFTLRLKDTTIPLDKIRNKITSLAKFESEEEEESKVISHVVARADEAFELPPVVPLSNDYMVNLTVEKLPSPAVDCLSIVSENGDLYGDMHNSAIVSARDDPKVELLNKIGEQQFEDVLFKPKKRMPRGKRFNNAGTDSNSDSVSVSSAHSAASESASSDCVSALPDSVNCNGSSFKRSVSEETLIKLSSSAEMMLDSNIQEDSEQDKTSVVTVAAENMYITSKPRSPTKIKREVADKEKILAKILNLESLCLDHSDNSKSEGNKTEDKISLFTDIYKYEQPELLQNITYSEYGMLPVNLDTQKSVNADVINSPISEHEDCGVDDLSDERVSSVSSALSYGPPSDSSAPPSLYTTSDVNKVETPLENNVVNAIEQADKWLQYKVPDSVNHLAVCQNYVSCIDSKNTVYYSALNGLSLRWQKLDYRAKQVALSLSGNLVWKLHKNVACAVKNPSFKGPFGSEWLVAAYDVQCIALGEEIAWIVSQDGRVYVQKHLSSQEPCKPSNTIAVHCSQPITYVCCYEAAVIVLTSTGEVLSRTGITPAAPEGKQWKKLSIPDFGVCGIALGPHGIAWIINNKNYIYYSDDFEDPEPNWWQLLVSDYIFQQTSTSLQQLKCKITESYLRFQNASLVASNDRTVWIADRVGASIHMNKSEFIGHRWSKVKLKHLFPTMKWLFISAAGIFEDKGQLWMMSQAGDLFCSQPFSDKFHALPLPCVEPIVCLSTASMTLWLLNSEGNIFIRQGISDSNPDGSVWQQLDLTQLEDVHLKCVSCGCDTVWACDSRGMVYMTVGSPHLMSQLSFSSVWIPVEDKTSHKFSFTKVFAGPHTYMVWAIDNKKTVYVREGIFNDFQLGTGWVPVTGIEAVDITISSTAVWVLTPKGKIYRRYGITENNFIGDYWKQIPGFVSALTASVSDGLWALDRDSSLLKHYQLTVRLTTDGPESSKPVEMCSQTDDDWEYL